LRAIAACEIVICHSDLVVKHFSDSRIVLNPWYRPFGGVGVELFFIVSGYIMCLRAPMIGSFSKFIVSRILRIYPAYWLYTTLVVIVTTAVPAWQPGGSVGSLRSFLRSYLVLPDWGFPILGVGWTLEYEMIFYLIVALALASGVATSLRSVALALVLAVLGGTGCVLGPRTEGSALLYHIVNPYMFAFGAGWLFRSVERTTWPLRILNLVLFAAIAVGSIWIGPDGGERPVVRIALASVVFCSILLARNVFQADNPVNRTLWLVGDASFSLYLCHWFVLSAGGKILGLFEVQPGLDIIARVAGVLLSVAVGVGAFRYIEKPLDAKVKGWFGQRRSVGTAIASPKRGRSDDCSHRFRSKPAVCSE
jgi:exopolysaccharide production protein ExoZ